MGKDKINILFIDHDPVITGSTVSLLYILKAFSDAGYSLSVLTPKKDQYLSIYKDHGVAVYSYGNKFFGTTMLDLHFLSGNLRIKGILVNIVKFLIGFLLTAAVIGKFKPQLIYLNEYTSIQSAIAAYILRIPVVTHIRSRVIEEKGIRRKFILWAVPKFSNLVIAISNSEKEQFENISGSKKKIIIVREFLFETDYCSYDTIKLREYFEIPENKNVILNLGGIASFKGTLDFLKAAEILLKERNDFYFIIAGTNHLNEREYYKSCNKIISEYSDNIINYGFVKNSTELIAATDILASTITRSHFSRPLIEAWAQKKAVITSKNPHALEFVKHKENGIIVEEGDYAGIKDGLILLADNKDFAKKLGINGYLNVRKYFDGEKNTSEIIERCKFLIHKQVK
jgi:glycosyltransferase involved in cell wall biosynthesis